MGTYMYFKLKVVIDKDEQNTHTPEELIACLRRDNGEAEDALNSEGDTNDESGWCNWNSDLKEFSKKNPTVLFILNVRQALGDLDDLDLELMSEAAIENAILDRESSDFYYKNGEEFFMSEDGVLIKCPETVHVTPLQKRSKEVTTSPISQNEYFKQKAKTEWELWMEKSRAARNNR